MTATIELSDSAMFELLTSALEAYTVKHQESDDIAIETVSHLWGRINKRAPFKCSINHVSTETSAIRAQNSVTRFNSSLEIKRDIANVFGEDYQHIGTFHTHPWLRGKSPQKVECIEDVRKFKLFDLSDTDHISELGSPTAEVSRTGYSVALIMTIFPMERANDSRMPNEPDGLHEFSLGNLKLWLKGQVFIHKAKHELSDEELVAFETYNLKADKYDEDELLAVPVTTRVKSKFIDNLGYYLQGFGRIDLDAITTNQYTPTSQSENRELHKV
ncbi:hypothetical protein F0236_06950 [Vibrio splendidus]|uniref:hypothetical protein n=1 Tax=Vibrio splendidus TaxID=29497 RepID=UPI00148D2E5E|nr:hypothetical protein [Vibrio splendidus]NOJ03489.1 hypothetical protein [Vibrio splendidus]